MDEKILFIDDDPQMLEAYKRQLEMDFTLDIASSGQAGLALLSQKGPYAVVVADMRMPEMDGIQCLMEVNKVAPNTIRMMLTGNADLQTAINAVNNGQIFRFMTKPCPPETLENNLKAGIRQYQLIMAEQELLSKTLIGSVQILTEIISSANPEGFRKTNRIRKLMEIVVRELKLEDGWRYELAAMLCQIGWLSFPPELMTKIHFKEHLSKEEERMFISHPQVARQLLEKIPRLSLIGRMIEGQQKNLGELHLDTLKGEDYTAAYGANMLRACLDYDHLISSGMTHESAMLLLSKRQGCYKPEFLIILNKINAERQRSRAIEEVRLEELEIGMILVEGIWDYTGNVIIPKGSELSHPNLMKIYSLNYKPGFILEPIKVIRPNS